MVVIHNKLKPGVFTRGAALGTLIASVAAGAFDSGPGSLEKARDFYNAGTWQLASGKLREAEALLENAVAAQDDSVQARSMYNLGHVRFGQGLEELKKGPPARAVLQQGQKAADAVAGVVDAADEALRANVVAQMVQTYLRGRGARKELKAATEAVKKALAAHNATLSKWERASGDFAGAHELDSNTEDASHNTTVVDRHIARLVDSLRELQQMAGMLGKSKEELKQTMKQLKGQIPEPDMPPGADGDDEEDEDKKDGPEPGDKERPARGEEELTPEQAAWLLEGYRLDSERRLPMGQSRTDLKDKNRRDW